MERTGVDPGDEGAHVTTTLVIIPTFNERETLPDTVRRTRSGVPDAEILVVDDASPDGTGDVADALAAGDDRVHVLHRRAKEGLGRAYIAGFRWALGRDYDVVVEMDADGSHRAEDLPRILAALASVPAELALGSRWVSGGRVVNWPRSRRILSRGGNAYTRLALGLPVRDATGGFRAYRASSLRALPLDEIESQGYCFQVDMVRRVIADGGHVVEVPITFVERRLGQSKMSRAIVAEALWRVTLWGATLRASHVRSALRRLGRRPHADHVGR